MTSTCDGSKAFAYQIGGDPERSATSISRTATYTPLVDRCGVMTMYSIGTLKGSIPPPERRHRIGWICIQGNVELPVTLKSFVLSPSSRNVVLSEVILKRNTSFGKSCLYLIIAGSRAASPDSHLPSKF